LSRVGRKNLREKEPTRFLYVRLVTVQSQDSFSNKAFCIREIFHYNIMMTNSSRQKVANGSYDGRTHGQRWTNSSRQKVTMVRTMEEGMANDGRTKYPREPMISVTLKSSF
jgi:hypothetical protein